MVGSFSNIVDHWQSRSPFPRSSRPTLTDGNYVLVEDNVPSLRIWFIRLSSHPSSTFLTPLSPLGGPSVLLVGLFYRRRDRPTSPPPGCRPCVVIYLPSLWPDGASVYVGSRSPFVRQKSPSTTDLQSFVKSQDFPKVSDLSGSSSSRTGLRMCLTDSNPSSRPSSRKTSPVHRTRSRNRPSPQPRPYWSGALFSFTDLCPGRGHVPPIIARRTWTSLTTW